MKIEVLFFARMKDIFGESRRSMEVPEGWSAAKLAGRIVQQCGDPALQEIPMILAVNEDLETGERTLKDRDQLAIMTPMSGG